MSALAYETLQLDDGSLPLLAPMSEVAGRLAVQVGAWCLQAQNGGRGVLLSGASGVRPATVVILGAGIAGTNACQVAVGIGRPRLHPRRRPGEAALRARHPRRPRDDGDVEPRQRRGGGRWRPTW